MSERLTERVQARFHTVSDVALMTNLSDDTVRRAINDGDLVAYKLRGQLRVRDRDFEAWVGRCRVQPGDASLTQDVAVAPVGDYRW